MPRTGRTYLSLISLLLIYWLFPAGSVLGATGWTGPNALTALTAGSWYKWPSTSYDGQTIVFLATPSTSNDVNQKQVQVIEFKNGQWTTPLLVASNGVDYSDESSAVLPEYTHPVISGNGSLIAYLGATATGDSFNPVQYDIYVVERTDTGWGTPYVLPTNFSRHDYLLDVSYDGGSIAYVYASANIFSDTPTLYVSTRTNGTWGTPVLVSDPSKGGAYQPSLSADGTLLVWMQNNGLVFSQYNGTGWSTPQWLVNWQSTSAPTVIHPKISPNGQTIFYWLLTATQGVATGQDLYAMKTSQTGWGAPVKLTNTPVIPTLQYDSPPAVDSIGSRVVYQRTVQSGGVINGSYLEITELKSGNWTVPAPLTSTTVQGFNSFPVMTPDGSTVIYTGSGEILSMTASGPTVSFTLAVTESGTGKGTVSAQGLTCSGAACSGSYSAYSPVLLTAKPDGASAFTGWAQACTGTAPTCQITMDAGKNVTATFDRSILHYNLSSGWNLISLPVQPVDTTISLVLSGMTGPYQIVWGYPSQAWKFYDPNDPLDSKLATMEAGKGYWINTTSAQTLTVSGSMPPSSLSLAQGWNLLGYDGASCKASSTVLSSLSTSLQVAWGYSGQSWTVYDPNDAQGSTLTQFCPNNGYWIKVNKATTWSGW